MEIRNLSAVCSSKTFTYNIRILLDKEDIDNTPNFYRDLHLSTLDGQCSDEFITDKGWLSKTIVTDNNYNRLSSIVISNKDCKSHNIGMANNSVDSMYSGQPSNMQELNDRINEAIPGIAGDLVKGMFGSIFGGGNSTSGSNCEPLFHGNDIYGSPIYVNPC